MYIFNLTPHQLSL